MSQPFPSFDDSAAEQKARLAEDPVRVALSLNINGRIHSVQAPDDMPLLWVLRDLLNPKGTKFGCGIAQCGACTVHVDGRPVRSCMFAAYEIYAHGAVALANGMSAERLATIAAGLRPADLTSEEGIGYDMATALLGAGCRRHQSGNAPTPSSVGREPARSYTLSDTIASFQ